MEPTHIATINFNQHSNALLAECVGHSPHSLMREDVFEDVDNGRGKAFGTDVHDFAEVYARGDNVELNRDDSGWHDKQHVLSFLDGLSGDLLVEEDADTQVES